jgi:16S rRNA (cytosine1402-N4)-methyltransferase
MYIHYPVLHGPLIKIINKYKPSLILDCTFGLGGHTQLILENTEAQVVAIDCDPQVIPWVKNLQEKFPNRLRFINKKFSEAMVQLVEENNKFDWVIADFGLSSMQIDDKERGFSFTHRGPLAMDMDQKSRDRCQWLVNESSVKQLSQVIQDYGQEKNFYNIVKNIIAHRPIYDTMDLRYAIEEKIYDRQYTNKTLSRVFQAIRIYTNQELEEIKILLDGMKHITTENTGFCLIYFHSLEGDVVHQWQKKHKKNYNHNIVIPSDEELEENSRSRSAKMVVIYKNK